MSSRTRRGARLITCALIAAGLFALATREARPDSLRESAPGGQYDPALAFGATNTLAVWNDQRGGDSIFGGRVTHAGTVLDPQGIPISLAPNNQYAADVASYGANYLVTWSDERSAGTREIYAARVNGDGTVLDPGGIPVSTGGCCRSSPAVGFGSTKFLVAWSESASGASDIRGARVTTEGVVLDAAGFAISSASGWQWNAAIASDGTNHFVVWEDERTSPSEIYGTRVTADGVVLDPQGIRISSGSAADFPAVAFDGVNYLVTWADSRAGIDVYGARVTPGGVVLDASGIPISTSSGTQSRPSLDFDGMNYMVVWEDYRAGSTPHVYAARVSPAGAVLDPAGIPVLGPVQQYLPDISFGPIYYLVAWADGRSDWEIYGSRVTPSGNVLDPNGFLISTGSGPPAPPPPPPIEPPPPQPPPAPPPTPPPPPPAPPPPPQPPPLPPPPPPPPPPAPPPPPQPPPAPPPPPRPPPPPEVRCVVPRVIGMRLVRAKPRIRRANCSVGRVRRTRARRTGRVVAQSPRPGVVRRRGFPVNLVVGRR